ncbi:plant expansin [Mycena rebaudengoi]|nr:plant expansin [Mycena rebaudengoi]
MPFPLASRLIMTLTAFAAIAMSVPAVRQTGETFSGTATFYTPGLGACGVTNTEQDLIVAVGPDFFANSICGQQLRATFEDKEVIVTVQDECNVCSGTDLDFSPAAFEQLADLSVGLLKGVQWSFI